LRKALIEGRLPVLYMELTKEEEARVREIAKSSVDYLLELEETLK